MGCSGGSDQKTYSIKSPLKIAKERQKKMGKGAGQRLDPISLIDTQDARTLHMYHRYDLEQFPTKRKEPWSYFNIDIGPTCEHSDSPEIEFTKHEHKELMDQLAKCLNICGINMQRWDYLDSSSRYNQFRAILEQ